MPFPVWQGRLSSTYASAITGTRPERKVLAGRGEDRGGAYRQQSIFFNPAFLMFDWRHVARDMHPQRLQKIVLP